MYVITETKPMKEMPEAVKARLRHLSFGPDHGSMWRWTYHDGSTFCTLAYSCTDHHNQREPCSDASACTPSQLVGWACLTFQEEPIPVVGVYVREDHRGNSLAEQLLQPLLVQILGGTRVYAVSANYPKYPALLEQYGLIHEEWE